MLALRVVLSGGEIVALAVGSLLVGVVVGWVSAWREGR